MIGDILGRVAEVEHGLRSLEFWRRNKGRMMRLVEC